MKEIATERMREIGIDLDNYAISTPSEHCDKCIMLQGFRVEGGSNHYRCMMGEKYAQTCVDPVLNNKLCERKLCQDCVHCGKVTNHRGFCLSANHNLYHCTPDIESCRYKYVGSDTIARVANEKRIEQNTPKSYEVCASDDERKMFLLEKYIVRDEWKELFEQLEKVYKERKKIWESVGVKDGFTFADDVILPKDIIDVIPSIKKCLDANVIACELKRDFRRKYLHGGLWRINFAPGAIISAAQRDNDLYRNLACFAYQGGYEGTAAQMVFDPHIAVLEPVNVNGRKNNGFQMVFIDSTGIHGYGGCYTGSDNSSQMARELVNKFAKKVNGESVENIEENNAAIDALCEIVRKTSDTILDPNEMYARDYDGFGKKVYTEEEFDTLPSNEKHKIGWTWNYYSDIVQSYGESRYYGGFFDTGIKERVVLYDANKINEMICDEAGMFNPGETCTYCDDYFDPEDSGYNGEDYGLGDTMYCCYDCLQSAMEEACDQRIGNVFLIDGQLYEL